MKLILYVFVYSSYTLSPSNSFNDSIGNSQKSPLHPLIWLEPNAADVKALDGVSFGNFTGEYWTDAKYYIIILLFDTSGKAVIDLANFLLDDNGIFLSR